jgi:hypothetical protein
MGSENISHGNVKNGGDTHVQSILGRGDDDPQYGTLVAIKYRGTISDQREMSVLGRAQVLRVRMRRPQLTNPQMTMCRGTFDSSPSSALDVV